MFETVLHDLQSGGWIANLVVGIALFLILSAIGAFINTPRSKLYGAAVGFTILFWVVVITWARHLASESPTSSAQMEAAPIRQALNQGNGLMVDDKSKPERSATQENVNSPGSIPAGRDVIIHQAPQQAKPAKPVQHLTIATEEISSPRDDLPYALSVIIQTTVAISPVHIAVTCSGPIVEASITFSPPPGAAAFGSSMFGKVTRINGNVYEFSFNSPPFSPQSPLAVRVLSATRISVTDVKRLD